MTVVVTGATGHVGANVCRGLLGRGLSVRALHRSNTAPLAGLDLERREGDVLDPASLDAAFLGARAVIHLAARISIDGDPDGSVWRTNVEGPRNVVDACMRAGVERLVHVSSFHAFRQDPIDRPLTEERSRVGADGYVYDRSKAAGEREIDRGVAAGLEAVILNPTGIIGPFDFGPSLMGSAILDMYHGRMPALVPGGSDWVDVRDVAGAAIAALGRGDAGDRHLLSGGWTSLRDLAALVSRAAGRRPPRATVPGLVLRAGLPLVRIAARAGGVSPVYTRQSLDALTRSSRDVRHDRASRTLDFAPRPLEETLADALEWYGSVGMLRASNESRRS
ncbi:MAG: NAD-dependent epimerase/dehydratase family protein [Gemmatimonadota bacterium]|nr:NAD-dependent epimerase/dehydratase family protein [Gemmatimonadota bacterium]